MGFWISERGKKRKTLEEIADAFSAEAALWAHKSFQIDPAFNDWHRASIYHLQVRLEYVKRKNRAKWDKIEPWWNKYTDNGKAITHPLRLTYNREDCVEALYRIADELRSP